MRALLLIDPDFATRERSMLARVEVGLADEGIRLIHAIPDDARLPESDIATRVVTFAPDRLGFTLRGRARNFLRDIASRLSQETSPGIDIVHVIGRRWWALAEQIAHELDAALVIEFWRSASIERAATIARRSRPLLLASDPALLGLLEDEGLADRSHLAAWGVHVPSREHEILTPKRESAIMIVGSARGTGAIQEVIAGVASAIDDETLVFVDASLAPKAHIWRIARQHQVLDRLSIIEDMEGARDLVLQGDLLVIPSAMGENRSIVLDAMAHGMLVVAPRDDAIEPLADPERISLVPESGRTCFRQAVEQALASPETARRRAHAGRRYVQDRRRASVHISAILDAYERVASREPVPIARGRRDR